MFVREGECLRFEQNGACASQDPAYTSQNRTERYRYDALGRRVLVRTTTPTGSVLTGQALCDDGLHRCDNTTRRTIWDGDQILAETRYPNAQPEQDSGLDSLNVAERNRRDDIAETDQGHPYGGHNTSWWAPHGRVLYVHGGGMDQPLGLIRSDYSYDFPDPVLIVPHANWRGAYETSTFADGNADRCKTVWLPSSEVVRRDSTGRVYTLPLDAPDTTQARCIERDFPGAYMGMTRLLKRQTVYGPHAWQGSLVQDGSDASGLSYRRNRYYDPSTGRFTQEDPIGIAGGLNVYGFAGGDPVNYSDPYGLTASGCCKSAGWKGAFLRGLEWVTGFGPANRTYSEGSVEVAEMKRSDIVKRARAFWYDKNYAAVVENGGQLEPVTNYQGHFGAKDHFRALDNATEFFVGSARIDIAVTEKNQLQFTLTNTTSVQSGFGRIPLNWERRPGVMFGNTRQVFTWTEDIEGNLAELFPKKK